MKVLIVGMRGVGMETAKNLALQGVGGITLIDSNISVVQDMGVNFFISEEDVNDKKTRADAVAPKLKELNTVCNVHVEPLLTEDVALRHSAVVITDKTMSSEKLVYWNDFCRNAKISFTYCFTGGVAATLFVDHGDGHIIVDPNGERPVQKLISAVSRGKDDSYILVRYESPEGQPQTAISDGVYTISDMQGFLGLNGGSYTVTHPYSDPVKTVRVLLDNKAGLEYGCTVASESVSIRCDGSELSVAMVTESAFASVPMDYVNVDSYTSGGLLTEKKVPFRYPMKSLRDKLKDPGSAFADPPTLVLTDMINFGAELQQHVAWYATTKFVEKSGGTLPRVNNEEDIAAVLQIAKELVQNGDVSIEDFVLDEDTIKRFARHAGMEMQAMSAFAGGVLAQEIVKCSGKFTPIPGFLHFAANESLPCEPPTDVIPRGSRYDELASVYGWEFVNTLGNLVYFMVGCGALGCEFMKNFALNGICCGEKGKLYVTDADRIELSNLSRQFLFREHNVGQPKSRAAGAMAKQMNPEFTVEALEIFVGSKTENVFDDKFWTSLDGVCNALDNMESRIYVDVQCVKYEKSLLESGTMGTSCNVDTICPFKTRTYRDGGNAAETGGVPMCTLRNFPHLTDHCIEWSRDQFELLFTKLCKTCAAYKEDPAAFEEEKRTLADMELSSAVFDVRSVLSFMKASANPSIGSAAQCAFDLFHFLFRDKILDLQGTFPVDARIIDKNGVDKGPFWSEKKRYPTAAVFNPDDESHWTFMQAATCMFGVSLGVLAPKQEDDDQWLANFRSKEWIVNLCQNLVIPVYIPVKMNTATLGGAAASDDNADKEEKTAIMDSLLDELRNISSTVTLIAEETQDFEKDDDLNFHIAFITACSNLRCDNYSITRTDFHQCKIIAGKIIAAIATTTAAACGLVILELFKLVLKKDTEAFMNRQIGLAVNSYTSFTQEPPVTFKTYTEEVIPSPDDDSVPEDAFDETGKVKPEYILKRVRRAYPENHSTWDKIKGVRSDMTLKTFAEWMQSTHNLKMTSWNFVLGSKKMVADGETKQQHISAPIYPPTPILDYSLLPALDLSMPQATASIMRNPAAKPTQQYIALWKKCKADGKIPSPEEIQQNLPLITENSTLYEVLQHMHVLADKAEQEKRIDVKAISSLENRKMWVIPGSETPVCRDLETGDDIDFMAAIQIDIV